MKDVNNNSTSIKNWAPDDRPREKLLHKGSGALSNAELLAILLGKGTRQRSAVDLARELLGMAQNNMQELGKMGPDEFMRVKGIGSAKAIALCAALEIGRRRQTEDVFDKPQVTSSEHIARFLKARMGDETREVFALVLLNNANRIIYFEIVSEGGRTGTVADPRIILKKALEKGAVKIILAHNHPSGVLKPSHSDQELTQKIAEAAALMDIRVIDHIILGEGGYFSFTDEGLL
jgi:DNA repair protein RadC